MTCECGAEILDQLRDIRQKLEAIRALLEPKRCTPADLEVLARILPAAAGLFGSSAFRTRELLADPAIRALISSSPEATGALLARCADDGVDVAGLRLTRAGKEGNAVLWSVGRTLPDHIDRRRPRMR